MIIANNLYEREGDRKAHEKKGEFMYPCESRLIPNTNASEWALKKEVQGYRKMYEH